MLALKVITIVFATFFALCIACAIWHARRRIGGIGVQGFHPPRRVDPYSSAFGDVPYTGFTARQLGDIAPVTKTGRDYLCRSLDLSPSAIALRRNAGSGHSDRPSWMSAARNSFAWLDGR